MKKILKQDNLILGIIIGAVAPWILFSILYFLNIFLSKLILHDSKILLLQTATVQLIAIVVNVFMMRQYMVKLKFDKTGRGILLLTFVYILAYFINDYLIK